MHPRERTAGWNISPHVIPVSRGVQHGGPWLHPDPPGIPQPTLASAVLTVRCVGGLAVRSRGMGSNPGLLARRK